MNHLLLLKSDIIQNSKLELKDLQFPLGES